jgi:hypothetical protein
MHFHHWMNIGMFTIPCVRCGIAISDRFDGYNKVIHVVVSGKRLRVFYWLVGLLSKNVCSESDITLPQMVPTHSDYRAVIL